MASGRDLRAAVGQLATSLLIERPCRIWNQVRKLTPSLYVPVDVDQPIMAFVPAMAIGTVCIPSPLGADWQEPVAGPLARQLGLTYARDPFGPRFAKLYRQVDGAPETPFERVRLREYSMPAILLPEFAEALLEARTGEMSPEWQSGLRVNADPNETWIFKELGSYGASHDGRPLLGYALVPDRVDWDLPGGSGAAARV